MAMLMATCFVQQFSLSGRPRGCPTRLGHWGQLLSSPHDRGGKIWWSVNIKTIPPPALKEALLERLADFRVLGLKEANVR